MKDIIKSIVAGATESVVVSESESTGFKIGWSEEVARYNYAGIDSIALKKQDPIAVQVELLSEDDQSEDEGIVAYAALGGSDNGELYLELGVESVDGSAHATGFMGTPSEANWNAYKAIGTIVMDHMREVRSSSLDNAFKELEQSVVNEVRAAGLKVKMVRGQ